MTTVAKNSKAAPVFYERISPRTFIDREVDEAMLMSLIEAARWAPSSYSEQPWRFVYGRKGESETYQNLFSCLSEDNQKWVKQAPILMLTVAKTFFDLDGSTNRHALHDVGLAMGNFCTQAVFKEMQVHQMAGFDLNKATKLFQLPSGFEPVSMVAIGYSDQVKNDRKRKPIDELIIHSDMN
ncbi:MAG: nitroreductase [Cyclobacteriaceae bacterium]|nr:nitroreductase [Cyclobacteriaceae bacterium]